MTVAELIAVLQTLPQDLPVACGDEYSDYAHEIEQATLFEDGGHGWYYPANAKSNEYANKAHILLSGGV